MAALKQPRNSRKPASRMRGVSMGSDRIHFQPAAKARNGKRKSAAP
jgi:hypothetical protein